MYMHIHIYIEREMYTDGCIFRRCRSFRGVTWLCCTRATNPTSTKALSSSLPALVDPGTSVKPLHCSVLQLVAGLCFDNGPHYLNSMLDLPYPPGLGRVDDRFRKNGSSRQLSALTVRARATKRALLRTQWQAVPMRCLIGLSFSDDLVSPLSIPIWTLWQAAFHIRTPP